MAKAAVPAPLQVEIATIARDVTAPMPGFTLAPRDDILARRGGQDGLKIYQDLARDGHAGSVLRKRRAAVIAREWTVEAGGTQPDDLLAAELVRVALRRFGFDRLCLGLLAAVLNGYAVAEVMWEAADLVVDPRPEDEREGKPSPSATPWIVPASVKVRNARRFRFGLQGELRMLTWDEPLHGIPLPDRKFIVARYWAEENEDPYGRGLGHDLFWPVYFKRNGVALWHKALERFGQPFPYAEYPTGTPRNERQELLAALADLGQSGGLVVPQGSLVKLLETKMTGPDGGHAALVSVMDAEISKIVLGETLTTEAGDKGARSLGEVHDDVRQELADGDADLLSAELKSQVVRWIVELNLPGAAVPDIWRRAPEQVDLKAQSDLDKALFDMGFEPTDAHVSETYGDHYQRKAAPEPPAPPRVAGPPQLRLVEHARADGAGPLDELVARLAVAAAPSQEAVLNAIRREVEMASSYEDLEQRFLRLSAALPIEGLAQALQPVLLLANLTGRDAVGQAAGHDE
ncbi:DUF935 family protein [Pararoseomonas sp. SCSIO 73927]|uniref:DUF935 domain-containing protein n=1 Tax=Pararoseomonas sp. SCSIO 73927 TaxID=3114537 RepID=UPI0030CF3E46